MNGRSIRLSVGVATLVLLGGCAEQPDARGVFEPQFTHNGKQHGKGTTWSEADVTGHDVPAASWTLVSTCPGYPSINDSNPRVVWPQHDQCANITLQDGTALTDEPTLEFGMKGGSIVWVQFRQQDVIGPEGIQYESERVSISPAVPFTGAGMVLHVHATDIPVYQLKGHIGGPRVRLAGTMNIGDVAYR
jgi:hypothetical protein